MLSICLLMKTTITKETVGLLDKLDYDITHIVWLAGVLCPRVLAFYPSLQILDCSSNELESLDGLDGCPNIRVLICRNNRLTSLAGIE